MTPRKQAGLAATASGGDWILVNASPDLRSQLFATPALRPRPGDLRSTPVKAVVLTGAEIDQTAGLLTLREGQPLVIAGPKVILDLIRSNPMFDVLKPPTVTWHSLKENIPIRIAGIDVELFPVPGRPPHFAGLTRPEPASATCFSFGLELRAAGGRLVCVPSCSEVDQGLRDRVAVADVLLFDGTFYRDDDMQRAGVSKTARSMGHLPIDGPDGSLRAFGSGGPRRVYIHINNTNPMLIEGSEAWQHVTQAGWEIAEDGMEIAL